MVIKNRDNKNNVSVIIVSYNTKELLKDCIDSVIKCIKGVEYEIIIVDNGSSDTTVGYLKSISSNKVIKVIFNEKNIGFGGANNIGIDRAKYEYLLFLNSDTRIESNLIEEMIEELKSNKGAGCIGCSLKNADGSIQGTGGYFPSLLRVFSWMVIQDLPLVDRFIKPFHPMKSRSFFKGESFFRCKKELDWVTGAFMLMRKKAVKDTGYFDTDYFMYTEEVDYFFRMKEKGWKVIYDPKWSITHLGGKSGEIGSNILLEYEGVKTFYKKHYPAWQYPILRLLLKTGSILRMIIFGLIKGKEDFALYAKAFTKA